MTSDTNLKDNTTKRVAVIVGAGPAGLTAAYQLLKHTDIHPIVIEATDTIGGISQTVKYKGNRMDIGGHRFFSKNKDIVNWWQSFMPMQGAKSKDDILLGLDDKPLAPGGPDPERADRVMLTRHRVSRIYWLRKFFDYPVRMKYATFANMGLKRTVNAGLGFLWASVHKLPETSLENFYINRFGRPLYEMFFEAYTQKVWGVHPSRLGADWGSQRVKGLSVAAILKDMFAARFSGKRDSDKVETSLIEEFMYPKYGPGHLWETVADEVKRLGGEILMSSEVDKINIADSRVVSVQYCSGDERHTVDCDYLISSMPIKDLIDSVAGVTVPQSVMQVSSQLPYRDFITVGLLLNKTKIKNLTKIKTYAERVPDTWIYIQERSVKIGRLQVFNNWSPYLVKDYENTVWLGLEYFCNEGDELWNIDEQRFKEFAIDELQSIDVIDKADVLDSCYVRIKKAYPAYHGSYYQLGQVRQWLDGIDNLYCIGRNGQHRYNNMDHSMLTAMECVDNIRRGDPDKDKIWNVNTEKEYHESK